MLEKHPIIFVDDDEDDRQIFQEGFSQAGCNGKFIQFGSGNQLLEFLQTNSSDEFPLLILLDLNMPGTDGREVLRQLKTTPEWIHIPVVVFTTSTHERDRKMAYELGANCFVSKPAGYQEVLDVTRSIAELWCNAVK